MQRVQYKTRSLAQGRRQELAVNVTRSWLHAVSIECDDSRDPGCDLLVLCANGDLLNVAIVASFDDPIPDADDLLVVLAEEIGHYSTAKAIEAFHVITEVAGYGRPVPVNRGTEPSRKEIYGSDFFLQAARHREFRSSPDLKPQQRNEYAPIVKRCSKAFFGRNLRLCLAQSYQVDDLISYAWVWTHVYVHRYQVHNPTHVHGDDNARLLSRYLKHRFLEFKTLLLRNGKNVLPDADVAQIAILGRTFDENDTIERFSVDPRKQLEGEPAVDDDGEGDEDDEESASRRRRAAQRVLKANLEALPHDDMVSRLKTVAESTVHAYATRREARRQLLNHFKGCAHCAEAGLSLKPLSGGNSEEVNVRRHENAGCVDAPCGEEDLPDLLG